MEFSLCLRGLPSAEGGEVPRALGNLAADLRPRGNTPGPCLSGGSADQSQGWPELSGTLRLWAARGGVVGWEGVRDSSNGSLHADKLEPPSLRQLQRTSPRGPFPYLRLDGMKTLSSFCELMDSRCVGR